MKVIAKFKGVTDNVFNNGDNYTLNFTIQVLQIQNSGQSKGYIVINKISSAVKIPYESLKSFLKNWEVI